jgi:hypothetical protein
MPLFRRFETMDRLGSDFSTGSPVAGYPVGMSKKAVPTYRSL